MAMPSGKIATYIGFARRARKVKVGVNAISTVKGRIPLMLVCATGFGKHTKRCKEPCKKAWRNACYDKNNHCGRLFRQRKRAACRNLRRKPVGSDTKKSYGRIRNYRRLRQFNGREERYFFDKESCERRRR